MHRNFQKENMKALITAITLLIISMTTSMAQNLRPAGFTLTDETCNLLCAAAEEKSRELGIEISFAIADADGLPRLFRRFGNALVLSTTLVPAKAYTSAITQTPTGELGAYVADCADLMGMNTCDRRITVVPGGVPLFADGKIVGAIGVGGGSKAQDMEIADFVAAKFNELVKQE